MKTYRIFIVNRRDERDRGVYGDRPEHRLEISLEQARNRIHKDYYIEHKEVFKIGGEFRTLEEIRLLHNETTTFLQKEINNDSKN